MDEFERVPIPVTQSHSIFRELFEALTKATAAGEALRLPADAVASHHSLRANVSRWALAQGYRAHLQKQPDGSWIIWLEAVVDALARLGDRGRGFARKGRDA